MADSATVWLFFREGVAKSPCRCGSASEIYTSIYHAERIADFKAWVNFYPTQLYPGDYKGEYLLGFQ